MRSLEQILQIVGKYEFCNLSSDDYYIVVDKSTLPDGYEITAQNQGDDDNNDRISTQMMVRVILLPSPMIITTPLMGIYSPTYCLGDMIMERYRPRWYSKMMGRRELQM